VCMLNVWCLCWSVQRRARLLTTLCTDTGRWIHVIVICVFTQECDWTDSVDYSFAVHSTFFAYLRKKSVHRVMVVLAPSFCARSRTVNTTPTQFCTTHWEFAMLCRRCTCLTVGISSGVGVRYTKGGTVAPRRFIVTFVRWFRGPHGARSTVRTRSCGLDVTHHSGIWVGIVVLLRIYAKVILCCVVHVTRRNHCHVNVSLHMSSRNGSAERHSLVCVFTQKVLKAP
jgi:hypothetical protein